MARIEGTGIVTPSKEASKKSTAFLKDFTKFQPRRDESFIKTYEQKQDAGIQTSDFETERYQKLKEKYGDKFSSDASETFEKKNFFSMTTDPRNEVKVAAATGDLSGTFNESDFSSYMKGLGIKNPKGLPPTMQRMLKQNYQDDIKDGFYKEGQFINKAPKEEKPSFVAQTKNLAGSVFNAITGTQPAVASQIPGGMPAGTQFTSSNLDAAKAPTGDTSFASYRMAGQSSEDKQTQQQPSGVVTPFSQTYIKNLADSGRREGVNASGFQQANVPGSAFNTGKDESKRPKTVTVDGQNVAARQTVASLPSDYKQTEAKAFAAAEAYQQAKKNPNVKAGVDSKGQVSIKPANNTAKAKAQAAAFNRKASGKSISSVKAANKAKMKADAAARHAAFKKTGKSTVGARRAAAKKSVQAAAKKRHAAFKKRRKNKKKKKCDIFLKYNIAPLTNMNLVRDDLAEVAYFVKEIQEK